MRKAQRGGDGGASATRGDESVARDSAAAAVASPSTDDAAATDDDAGSEKLKKRRRKKKKAVDEAIIANMDDVTSATALDASESMQESTGESVASILSTDDWKSMLSCSYVSYYTAGEAIVDRTRPPAGLLQIVSGKKKPKRNNKMRIIRFAEIRQMSCGAWRYCFGHSERRQYVGRSVVCAQRPAHCQRFCRNHCGGENCAKVCVLFRNVLSSPDSSDLCRLVESIVYSATRVGRPRL